MRGTEHHYRVMVEAMNEGALTMSADGTISYSNPSFAAMLKTPLANVIGARMHNFLLPEDLLRYETLIQQAEEGGSKGEVRLKTEDGSIVPVLLSLSPLVESAPHNLCAVVTDITERKAVDKALHKAQAELAYVSRLTTVGELAASLTHELNQSLTAIVTNSSACLRWLERPKPELEEATTAVQRIIRDAKHAGEVIAHTRALVKKTAGEKIPINTTEMIREALVLLQGELAKQRIAVHDSLEEDPRPVIGSYAQLQQVVLNLVMNSIEAMADVSEDRRVLLIRSEPKIFENGPAVLVAVEDAGIGIATENLDHVFEAFFTTKPSGLGLGLSISRSIIEAHDGRLSVTPNDEYGTTFEFILPVH